MSDRGNFNPDWYSPPGVTIRRVLCDLDIGIDDFAKSIEWSENETAELLDGRRTITLSLARKLKDVLGASTEFWITRDYNYRKQSRVSGPEERKWLRQLPIGDMIRFGWISPVPKPSEEVKVCLDFFGVDNIDTWHQEYLESPAMAVFRSSPSFDSRPASVAAWMRRGILEANRIDTKHWDSRGFRSCLNELRSLSRQKHPHVFLEELRERCANFGVAVVSVRAPNGCRASGAAKFITPNKAAIILSFRYRTDDHFWFSFFHEAAHLVLHTNAGMFIDADWPTDHPAEKEANEFAANILVPQKYQEELYRIPTEMRAIIRFARRIGVSPGIVVGQLQYAGRLEYNQFASLKRRYKWLASGIR